MAKMGLRWAAWVPCCIVALHLAGGAPDQKQSKVPTIQVQTELVLVPVIVHREGKHLGGLTREGFTLLAGGKPQPIAVFDEVHASTPGKAAPAGEFTNQPGGTSGTAGAEQLTIIAVDLVNTAPLDQASQGGIDQVSRIGCENK